MSQTDAAPTCTAHEHSDELPTCGRPTHVRTFPRDAAPTCETPRRKHRAVQALAGVLTGDWGVSDTPFAVELAAPTREVVCPVHGVVESE